MFKNKLNDIGNGFKLEKQEKIAGSELSKDSVLTTAQQDNQQKCVYLEKIQPQKAQILDIDSILEVYYGKKSEDKKQRPAQRKIIKIKSQAQRLQSKQTNSASELSKSNKTKIKQSQQQKSQDALKDSRASKKSQQEQKKLSEFSQAILRKFKRRINKSDESQSLNECEKFRQSCCIKLAFHLCLVIDQILEKSPNSFVDINQQDLLTLLSVRVESIDQQLFQKFNNRKLKSPSLILQSKWKFVIDLVSKRENYKLRNAIFVHQVTPQMLGTNDERSLLEYLPEQRQNQLKMETQKILKQAEKNTGQYQPQTQSQEDTTVSPSSKKKVKTIQLKNDKTDLNQDKNL